MVPSARVGWSYLCYVRELFVSLCNHRILNPLEMGNFVANSIQWCIHGFMVHTLISETFFQYLLKITRPILRKVSLLIHGPHFNIRNIFSRSASKLLRKVSLCIVIGLEQHTRLLPATKGLIKIYAHLLCIEWTNI